MTYYLGVDPDTQKTALAVVDENGEVAALGVLSGHGKGREAILAMVEQLHGLSHYSSSIINYIDAVAVEGQEIYSGQTRNPRSIMFLATVAGACLQTFHNPHIEVFFPAPSEWKGNVPKQIHQARIYSKLGWEYVKKGKDPKKGYCIPEVPKKMERIGAIKGADFKHIGDAIGLALWARAETLALDKELEAVDG